jgi:hypothetical protein
MMPSCHDAMVGILGDEGYLNQRELSSKRHRRDSHSNGRRENIRSLKPPPLTTVTRLAFPTSMAPFFPQRISNCCHFGRIARRHGFKDNKRIYSLTHHNVFSLASLHYIYHTEFCSRYRYRYHSTTRQQTFEK